MATDQPGWLRHVRHQPVIDLTGRASVSMLRTLTAAGTLDHVDREWRLHDLDVTAQAGAQGLL